MEITEVRIKLMENSEDRLRGFCSITFDDCFVVRDLKIIEGNSGPFVAMPSRKLTSNCHKCRSKNHLRARFCNQCGVKQRNESIPHDSDGRARLYADIAHPVNAECREMIQSRVIEEFGKEIDLSKKPGYVSRYDDEYDSDWKPPENKKTVAGKTRVDAAHDSSTAHERPGTAQESSETPPSPQKSPPQADHPTDTSFGQGIFD